MERDNPTKRPIKESSIEVAGNCGKKVRRKVLPAPMVDAQGFRRKQAAVDAECETAYEKLGGNTGGANVQGFPKNKTIREEEDDATEYSIEGPLRRTKPYYYTYMTWCKERWRGKTILEVFTSEFRAFTEEYYRQALEDGKVTLSKKVAGPDTLVQNGDLISHRMHRHEAAVTSRPIRIVHEDDDYVVIDKPSGIPAHPTGRYRHNTVTFILEHEMGIKAHPCNRLDRLTSGLMILGRNGKAAAKLSQRMKQREVSKQYVAKVVGEFPSTNEGVVVDQPLRTLEARLAFNAIDKGPQGKPAKTWFKRLSYNGKTSIVLCKPLTGRTHQIRVHLQYLGHPIVNDPLYSSPEIWGPNLGANAEFDVDEILSKMSLVGKTKVATSWLHPVADGEVLSGKECPECHQELYSDPGPNDLDLCLHAYKYESKPEGTATDDKFVAENSRPGQYEQRNWSYETELPHWALEDQKKYMAMALEEAKKCPPTDSAFCVGAVLTNGGEVLATGYSRELEGNTHAEQNALTKYFEKSGNDVVPPGTEIYTTMEPCSERLSGNLPCLDRILAQQGHITTCYVGVMEPSTFIAKNVSKEKLENAGIAYIKVPGFEEAAIRAAKKGHPGELACSTSKNGEQII